MVHNSMTEDGPIEARIFARFEKISYKAHLTFHYDYSAILHVCNDDLVGDDEGAARLIPYVRTWYGTACPRDMLREFVLLVSKSSFIRDLEVDLHLSTRITEYPGSHDFDFLKACSAKRATEMLAESCVLESLRELSNVKCFSLKLTTDGMERYTIMTLQLDVIKDLKEKIETNWMVKHGLS